MIDIRDHGGIYSESSARNDGGVPSGVLNIIKSSVGLYPYDNLKTGDTAELRFRRRDKMSEDRTKPIESEYWDGQLTLNEISRISGSKSRFPEEKGKVLVGDKYIYEIQFSPKKLKKIMEIPTRNVTQHHRISGDNYEYIIRGEYDIQYIDYQNNTLIDTNIECKGEHIGGNIFGGPKGIQVLKKSGDNFSSIENDSCRVFAPIPLRKGLKENEYYFYGEDNSGNKGIYIVNDQAEIRRNEIGLDFQVHGELISKNTFNKGEVGVLLTKARVGSGIENRIYIFNEKKTMVLSPLKIAHSAISSIREVELIEDNNIYKLNENHFVIYLRVRDVYGDLITPVIFQIKDPDSLEVIGVSPITYQTRKETNLQHVFLEFYTENYRSGSTLTLVELKYELIKSRIMGGELTAGEADGLTAYFAPTKHRGDKYSSEYPLFCEFDVKYGQYFPYGGR